MISVIIPSYQRPESLFGVLMNIYNQDVWRSIKGEILVSIDDSDENGDRYDFFIKQFQSILKGDNSKLSVRLIINSTKGLVLAKNKAIEKSVGELIMMMDDDLYMESDYISTLFKTIKEEKNCAATSGFIISSVPAISHTQASDYLEKLPQKNKIQTLNIKQKEKSWRAVFGKKEQVMNWSKVIENLPLGKTYEVDYFVNSYMFKKKGFELIGGYNIELNSKTSAHEEVDFTYRLGKKFGKLILNPSVKMWHITQKRGGIYKGKDFEESKQFLEDEYGKMLEPFLRSIKG
jgi:cellulose synthase/poly-beta-1,6-N-acetylglucosamine synthase-like glycosyltransferase